MQFERIHHRLQFISVQGTEECGASCKNLLVSKCNRKSPRNPVTVAFPAVLHCTYTPFSLATHLAGVIVIVVIVFFTVDKFLSKTEPINNGHLVIECKVVQHEPILDYSD